MSRVAKNPIPLPKGVEIRLEGSHITVQGAKGSLSSKLHPNVKIEVESGVVKIVSPEKTKMAGALAGTARANINNMILGVSVGYEKKLTLVGVGYRAQSKGDSVSLSLGFSHPLEYKVPIGIVIETPTQTEILVKGIDKQLVGQVAANIRAYRSPEPYKGKGIRYSDEEITKKEAKKK